MKYRFLGKSGLMVSELSLGNWLVGSELTQQRNARDCIFKAMDNGVTTFDTADVYNNGKAELSLGECLSGMKRSDFEVFTKVFFPLSNSKNDRGLSRKHIMESIDKSLERLDMDYVDLYQAHRFDHSTPLEETMLAFADVVRSGKAFYIGVSEWSSEQIRRGKKLADELNVPFISNQPQYSILHRVIEEEVTETCSELGISQIVWSPLAQGILTGKYTTKGAPKEARLSGATTSFGPYRGDAKTKENLLIAVEKYVKLVKKNGLDPSSVAIAWVLRNENVASAIVGASRPGQLDATLAGVETELDAALMTEIDVIFADFIINRKSEYANPSYSKPPENIRRS
jgi:aryl-alcohol dehydrogenase-like predicted oxidoreductase